MVLLKVETTGRNRLVGGEGGAASKGGGYFVAPNY